MTASVTPGQLGEPQGRVHAHRLPPGGTFLGCFPREGTEISETLRTQGEDRTGRRGPETQTEPRSVASGLAATRSRLGDPSRWPHLCLTTGWLPVRGSVWFPHSPPASPQVSGKVAGGGGRGCGPGG